jgi:hypothetical protein
VVARPDSDGEGTAAIIVAKGGQWELATASTNRLHFTRSQATTTARALTTTNAFVFGTVYAFAARIDASSVASTFINGVETTYGTHTTGVGTPTASSGQNLHVGGRNGSITYDGGIFDVAIVESALSDAAIMQHYEAAFLANATAFVAVAFSGSSITEAQPTGYRPLTEAHLTLTYPFARFTNSFTGGPGQTAWVRLWSIQDGLIATSPDVNVYESVSSNYEGAYEAQAKAIEEGTIRRLRGGVPAMRMIVIGMPTYANNTTPGATNPTQLTFLQSLCTQYDMTYIDWPARVQALIDATTYTLDQLYADIVHPTATGHAEIAALLQQTLTLEFINGSDVGWTGDLADYTALYDDGTFEDTGNYIARNGTDNDGTTGTWTNEGTTLVSSEVGATVTWSGTFETFGVDLDLAAGFSIEHNFDGAGWTTGNFSASTYSIHQLAPNFSTRGAHTVQVRVLSGTVKIRRFLAI